jgi:ATP-dependent Lhr-like helicase
MMHEQRDVAMDGRMDGQLPFHRVLADWFAGAFGEPTPVQQQAWPLIRAGRHVLISAPTGSGKTLAALFVPVDRVIRAKLAGGGALSGNVGDASSGKVSSGRAPSGKGVRILYVTPLKALNNDIRRHLFDFQEEWARTAVKLGEAWPGLTVGVRTGDTTQSTRASMIRRPPDLLVTTPESLYMLLTSHKARETLRTVETVVVDEIHDLAAGERGVHLSLSLERLTALCGRTPQRIGVSATQNPPERIARFLGGWEAADGGGEGERFLGLSDAGGEADAGAGTGVGTCAGTAIDESAAGSRVHESVAGIGAEQTIRYVPRDVAVVESRMERELTVQVTVPDFAGLLRNKREDVWTPLIAEIMRHIGDGGTTLIFVGNRRLCERLSARLNETMGDGFCRSHHGSVSRERRLETEQLLREGKLRCLVATSSLELGIDIGDIDRVLQIDSPQTAASGIQRFGRSGHAVGGTSRGTVIVRTRGLLPEVAVLADRIRRKETEPIEPPRHLLAVLAQQIVAMAAVEDWHADRLYRLVCQSDSYHGLPRERFDETLEMLAGLYPFVRPLIDWDRASGRVSGRPAAAMAAITGSGTIPSSSNYPVYHAESRLHLGELDEEFVFESRVGDTFQLGASNWRIRSIRPDRVEVVESGASLGEIPFWRAEGPGRTVELGIAVGQLMERLEAVITGGIVDDEEAVDDSGSAGGPEQGAVSTTAGPSEEWIGAGGDPCERRAAPGETRAVEWLCREHHFTAEAAGSLINLYRAQKAFSAWPTHRRIPVEWYTDDSGLTHVVIHSWFGRRFNRTWLMAIEHLLERSYPHEFHSVAKDNGIELVFRVWDPALLDRILNGVHSGTVEQLVAEALPASPLYAARFRQLAETSLLLSRSFRRTPSWLKRLRGQELLRDAMPVAAKFPLVKETMRDCMEHLLDVPNVRDVLARIEKGEIVRTVARCERPSPLAAQFFFDYLNVAIYESDALTRDLRQGMLRISRELAEEVFGREEGNLELGRQRLADEWTEAWREESGKLAERLNRVPESPDALWQLVKERGDLDETELRELTDGGEKVRTWFAELLSAGRIRETAVAGERRYICGDETDIYGQFPEAPHARAFVLGRFVETRASFGAEDLMRRYGLSREEADRFVEEWAKEGRIVPFSEGGGSGVPSSSAGEGIGQLASPPAGQRWISARLQERIERNVAMRNRARQAPPETLLRLLQERHHLEPERRLSGPEGVLQAMELLQGLFLPVSWWENIILPARVADYRKEDLDLLCASGELFWLGRRDEGAQEGKIAFFRADRPDLYAPFLPQEDVQPLYPELHERLRERGASFLTALAADTGEPPSQLTAKLLEMAWQGLVANDQFAPLRLHGWKTEPQGRGKYRSGLGRWYAVADLAGRRGTGAVRGGVAETRDGVAEARNGAAEARSDAVERSVLAWTGHLMRVFGVLTRNVVQAFSPYGWELHLAALSRMEDLGLAVRGLFVRDIPALQFAERDTVERLREMQSTAAVDQASASGVPDADTPGPGKAGDRAQGAATGFGTGIAGAADDSDHVILLSAADPANPFGLLLDWPTERDRDARFARKPDNHLLLSRGRWLLWTENKSRKITVMDPSAKDPSRQASCIRTAARHLIRQHGQRKVVIERIDGQPAAETPLSTELARTGAEKDGTALVIWPSQL